jgi:hypothetical protein
MPRGSREHVLEWTSRPTFVTELLALALPVDCRVTAHSIWRPTGSESPQEARLETFGPEALGADYDWTRMKRWWKPGGGNTPNWDIALSCHIEGEKGLILVEAKANVPELGESGKLAGKDPSELSRQNHDRIGEAIDEARGALALVVPGIGISRDKHYQLSNRIAFAWKLASMGIPTVLIYLGFIGDAAIANAGEPFGSEAHWDGTFRDHFEAVCPAKVLERRVIVGRSSFWILSRCRAVGGTAASVSAV